MEIVELIQNKKLAAGSVEEWRSQKRESVNLSSAELTQFKQQTKNRPKKVSRALGRKTKEPGRVPKS
jgi:hypothetical protein